MTQKFRIIIFSACLSFLFLGFPQSNVSAKALIAPTITGFSPTSGSAQTLVIINGANFSNVSSVQFNGVNASSYTLNSMTKITAHVPSNATTGPISVTTSSGTVTSVSIFGVTLGIALSATNGPPTTKIVITGTGFGANDSIIVTSDTSTIGTTNATNGGGFSVNVQIPATATPRAHSIMAIGTTSGKSAQQPFLVQTNWEYTGFNTGNNWYNPYENVLSASTIAQASTKWSDSTFNYVNDWNEPLVYKNRLFVTNNEGSVYAYDASTGAFLWQYAVNNGVAEIQTPFVVDNVLMIFASTQIFAVNATTGTLIWSGQAVNNININTFYSIGVDNGIFYAVDDIGELYAFQLTGCGSSQCSPLWVHTFSQQSSQQRITFKFLLDGKLFIELRTGSQQTVQFQAYNLSDFPTCAVGSCLPLWSTPSYSSGSIRAVSSSKIFTTITSTTSGYTSDEVLTFNIAGCNGATCAPVWSTPMPYATISPVAVSNNYLYLALNDQVDSKGQLFALGVGTGTIKWTTAVTVPFTQEIMVADNVVYAFSADRNIYAYVAQGCSSAICSFIWKFTVAEKYNSPWFIIVNGYLYISSTDSYLYALSV